MSIQIATYAQVNEKVFPFCFLIVIFFSLNFFLLVNQQVHLHEDLKIKFVEGAKERKELYNKVLELKG